MHGVAIDLQHPLLLDRPRLEEIRIAMYTVIQKQVGRYRARSSNGRLVDPALHGGVSADDVLQDAFEELLQHQYLEFAGSWEALAVDIARKRSIDAVRRSRKGLRPTEHRSEITVTSIDAIGADRSERRSLEAVPASEMTPEDRFLQDEAEYLSALRVAALRDLALEVLDERQQAVFFGVAFEEKTRRAIGVELGISGQMVGRIFAKAMTLIENDPRYPYRSRQQE
ncbi:sigma-70 family RNA polymerase sigma factor [Candidatus Poriferisodalis sp.]|uniref:sigma-70 family RNA polymerase sigma factor n=1 Tax=Candidatus Poriferisodalis sp. TaxID=3101277 RepID=UPI003B01F454